MELFCKFSRYFFVRGTALLFLILGAFSSLAQVSFSGGVAPTVCVGDPSYVTISNIVFSENANTDFTNIDGANRTFRIAPAVASRFEFEPGIGAVVFSGTGSG